jgi:hypothetical protein
LKYRFTWYTTTDLLRICPCGWRREEFPHVLRTGAARGSSLLRTCQRGWRREEFPHVLRTAPARGNSLVASLVDKLKFLPRWSGPTTKIGQIIKARAPAETVTRQLPSSIAYYTELHLVSAIVHSVSSIQLTGDPDCVRPFGGYNKIRRPALTTCHSAPSTPT